MKGPSRMTRCNPRELSAAIALLREAFREHSLTAGCRLEMALRIMRSALTGFSPRVREEVIGSLVVDLCEDLLPVDPPDPALEREPKALAETLPGWTPPTSLLVH